ncbi:MAG: xanthine dehydrogenase small subunit [Bacteroidales bacterium]|nr:xanthine dehydrogenase small subunit [Bacteroidales bacterium]
MSGSGHLIRFFLNDKLVEIDFNASAGLKPTTTVLNYLRSLPFYKGVKEGCAEGDCGACTVVVAEVQNGKLVHKAIDSCLVFLPMLYGKQLITVEHLADGKDLHPVQQAMVDENGSQCGYCTPGIVMSLFGIYKNHHHPSREVIQDALTGNLCRCTGYRPIIDAAESACSSRGWDHFSLAEANTIRLLDELNSGKELIEIHTSLQQYYKPFTLADALECRRLHPEALITCGSTDVALRQTKKKELLREIIDISDVAGLKFLEENIDDFRIGAGVSLENLLQYSKDRIPALYNILKIFGSLQIRNLATIGGNIGSASPIGDTLPVLFASRARVRLQSTEGVRFLNIEDFITGYRSVDLKPGELITEIIIPKGSPEQIIRSYKVSRRKDLDISSVSAGFSMLAVNGTVSEIILAFGGMAAQTIRATKTETFLTGKEWNQAQVGKAMDILHHEFTPLSDARAGADYRNLVARNLLMKFYLESSDHNI